MIFSRKAVTRFREIELPSDFFLHSIESYGLAITISIIIAMPGLCGYEGKVVSSDSLFIFVKMYVFYIIFFCKHTAWCLSCGC